MSVKPVHSYQPVKTTDLTGGVSYHTVDLSELRHSAADGVLETRGDFKVYRPGDIWRMLHGTIFR